MKVSIEKELERHSQVKKEQFNLDPLNEVKLLLNGESTEDSRILRGLSKNSQFNRIEKVRGEQLELEKHEAGFQGKVYTVEEVKRLAVDYHLRFLPSMYYTGTYDVEVAAKIKEFAKNTNSPIDDYSLTKRFYVLAPTNMFELQDEKYLSKADLRRMADPAIFFQIDEKHYRLIHKWGSDFTIFRYLEGFKWASFRNYWLFSTVIMMPIVAFLMALVGGNEMSHMLDVHPVGFWSLNIFFSVVIGWFGFAWRKQDEFEPIQGFFSNESWNSERKIRR
jgi:hypothetical protein